MKIIDLFNDIANGEEVPKKIKYKGWLYDWNEHAKDYECNGDWLEERINDDFKTFLNDEVEILEEKKLEEEKKIPEKLNDILRVYDLIPPIDENMYKIWKQTIKNHNKINEICDYLKSKGE